MKTALVPGRKYSDGATYLLPSSLQIIPKMKLIFPWKECKKRFLMN
jgi:hypothetical protein